MGFGKSLLLFLILPLPPPPPPFLFKAFFCYPSTNMQVFYILFFCIASGAGSGFLVVCCGGWGGGGGTINAGVYSRESIANRVCFFHFSVDKVYPYNCCPHVFSLVCLVLCAVEGVCQASSSALFLHKREGEGLFLFTTVYLLHPSCWLRLLISICTHASHAYIYINRPPLFFCSPLPV